MAGVSTKEIKNRIRSLQSTRQITKAMEMVAAAKLRRAQSQALSTRPYFESLYDVIWQIVNADRQCESPYLQQRPVRKSCYVVIAGDRGLAGGYNSNVLKRLLSKMEDKAAIALPIGKKAVDFFQARQIPMLNTAYAQAEEVSVGDCFTIANRLCKRYLAGEFDEIYVVYTKFVSVLSQTAASMRLLPLVRQSEQEDSIQSDVLYEPDSETVLSAVIPEYLGGVLYGALCESRASEQAARRGAMDAATQNAEEMIGDLSLQFNRARQAAITQEITEIVAGS